MATTATYATTQVKPGPQGRSALVLKNQKCGLITNLSSGGIRADVHEEKMGPGHATKKHVGGLHYPEISLDIGFAMSQPVFDWIATSWKNEGSESVKGSILNLDASYEARAEWQFEAMITRTTIPAMDTRATDPVWLGLEITPFRLTPKTASGKVSASDPKHPEKILYPRNFKLEVEGLDCSRVCRVDSFSVTQAVHFPGPNDDLREMTPEIGRVKFPNLRITFADALEQSWMSWFDDFVIQGNEKEKSGKLTLLSPNQQPLASIEFVNLGIFAFGFAGSSAADKSTFAAAEMCCDRMEFHFGK